jgi:hypothetical protein
MSAAASIGTREFGWSGGTTGGPPGPPPPPLPPPPPPPPPPPSCDHLNVRSKVLISWALVVVGTGGLVGGGVVWVVVWIMVVIAVWVIRPLPNVWVGEVLIGLFWMLTLVWSCSSWLSSSICSCFSSSSTVCRASSTCCCANVLRASYRVLTLRVPMLRVPLSLL